MSSERPTLRAMVASFVGDLGDVKLGTLATMFREARESDFSDVLHLYGQLQPSDPILRDGSDQSAFHQVLNTHGLSLFVLELEGRVIGTTYLNVIPNITRSASPYAVIENVVIEESLRARGLGKQLIISTLAAAWEAGCYKAMLMTGSRNPATHAFYKACGFSPDEKTAYVARPNTTR